MPIIVAIVEDDSRLRESLSSVGSGAPMSHMIAKKVVEYFQKRKSSNDAENLTKREHEIVTLLAKGLQDKEIAEMLGLSFFTVRGYIKNIYEKLHVRSRAEAVAKFL